MNLEASILIQCTIEDEIYKDVSKYMDYIKTNFCFQFDETKVDIYKKLQTRDAEKTSVDEGFTSEPQKVVTLVGNDMDTLVQEQIIQLLSLNEKYYAQFKTTGQELYLHTYDIAKKEEFLYKCRIEQTGKLDKTIDKLELDFTQPRRFAYIGTGKLAFLKKQIKVNSKILAVSKYFVNIAIIYKINEFEISEKLSKEDFSYWQTETANPYFKRLNLENSKEDSGLSSWLLDDNNFYVQKLNPMSNKHKFTIQVAVLDKNMKYKPVNLTKDWQIFHQSLEHFYANLEQLILQEYKVGQLIDNQQINEQLEKFLEEARKDKNLSQYSKSQIDRIIKALNTTNNQI